MSYVIGHGRYARETYPEPQSSSGSSAALLARGWADTGEGSVTLDALTQTVLASVTVIPAVTGHFRITITGSVLDTSAAPNGFSFYVGHGSDPPGPVPPSDYGTGTALTVPASGTAQFSMVADMDMLPSSPVVGTIGVPITFSVVGEANDTAEIVVHGIQIEAQEVFP